MKISIESTRRFLSTKISFLILSFTVVLIPFIITLIATKNLNELSKVVFSLYLIVPISCILSKKPNLHIPLCVSLTVSILENLEWRLYISQKINETYNVVINPQWLLVVITAVGFVLLIYRFITSERNLWKVFSLTILLASLTSTYAFHYLVINRGIEQAVSDHQSHMALLDVTNSQQVKIVCSIYRYDCVQGDNLNLPEILNARNLDRSSILSINEFSQKKEVSYAWRETDIISSALNGNGVLIGYINKGDLATVIIDRVTYTTRMNRDEFIFMALVIMFHSIWIPAWIILSIKHKNIRLKDASPR